MGRPSIYSEALAKEICWKLSQGESLRKICRGDDMPDITTVLAWASDKSHPFSQQYARAREIQAETLVEEIIAIADEAEDDFIVTESGREVFNKEAVMRSKLRVDARMWAASKILPKKYGPKVDVEHTGGMKVRVVIGGNNG